MKKWKGLIKFVLSILMLGLVLRVTDFDKLRTTLKLISLSSVVVIVCTYAVGQMISAYKWLLIARAGGIESTYAHALKSYFIGMFVNCFGVGTLGGDLARALLLAGDKPVKTAAVSSVIADRAQGLATIACIGAVGALIFGPTTLEPTYVYLMVLCGVGVFAGWFIGPALVRRFLPAEHPLRTKVEAVLSVFPHQPAKMIHITVIAICFHLLQISLHKYMGLSIGVDIPWAYLLVAIPFVNILSTIPISWNGLGVRENAYVFFLSPAVLTKEQALALGALWILSVSICSAIGGIFSALSKEV